MEQEARIALVTGGGRGIGRAIALGLAEDGADIAINYRRDDEAAQETVAEIEKLGRRAIAYSASVDDLAACEQMVAQVLSDFGAVDILVNNAGIAPAVRPWPTPTPPRWNACGERTRSARGCSRSSCCRRCARGRAATS